MENRNNYDNKKLAFFGGSFNPPTYAHIEIAKKSIKKFNLDKFFFVPVGNLYKKPELIDETYRYKMLKLACRNEKKIFVEDIELKQNCSLSASDAFELIRKKYQNCEILFVMGTDNFEKLPQWKDAQKLITNYKYIIFERNGTFTKKIIEDSEILNKNKGNFNIIKLEDYYDLSSGKIRKLIKSKEYNQCENLTKKDIIEYIKINNLYVE